MHNAFRAEISKTGWDISHKLSALYMLWDDVPARRDDYESVTKQNVYPLPFCAHRWVENVKDCERAMEIYPYVKQYVESVEKKESKDPGTKSFSTVREWSKDKFARAKLAFIVSVAKPVENFLKV
ncbi:hypothetical protein ACJMK2_014448 [Sinanodonta woodiana]|uniref:Uncharacterized protein n=1 Tax=Sinanodonta woodiana TaxID=1069815 RepID=A0ABD3V3K6_SINWO